MEEDIQGCATMLLPSIMIGEHMLKYDEQMHDVSPGDLLCVIVSNYKKFLTDTHVDCQLLAGIWRLP